jgi:hypothetical protein
MVRGTWILTSYKALAINAMYSSILKNHIANKIYYFL